MARPKCLMGNFTNLYRIYKAHQTNVWWTMKVFRLHCYKTTCGFCTFVQEAKTFNFTIVQWNKFGPSAVWYKTKIGSQNFGHQQWWPFVHGLPKLIMLIGNISSQFHHILNTVLAAGSLVKRIWCHQVSVSYSLIAHNAIWWQWS